MSSEKSLDDNDRLLKNKIKFSAMKFDFTIFTWLLQFTNRITEMCDRLRWQFRNIYGFVTFTKYLSHRVTPIFIKYSGDRIFSVNEILFVTRYSSQYITLIRNSHLNLSHISDVQQNKRIYYSFFKNCIYKFYNH